MQLMKKGFILMALILISIGIKSQPSRQWTLNECIQYALENNITLKKSKLAKYQPVYKSICGI